MTQEKHEAAISGDVRLESAARIQEANKIALIELSCGLQNVLAQRDQLLSRVTRLEQLVAQCVLQTPASILAALRSMLDDDSAKISKAIVALIHEAVDHHG